MGCVKAFTLPSSQPENGLSALRNAMREAASRLVTTKNIENSERDFQPVVDQLAIVEPRYPNSLTVKNAIRAVDLFDALKVTRIRELRPKNLFKIKTMKTASIIVEIQKHPDKFDQAYGFAIGWYYSKRAFGGTTCKVPNGRLPEDYVKQIVYRVLLEGSISPYEIAVNKWGEGFDSREVLKRLRYGWL